MEVTPTQSSELRRIEETISEISKYTLPFCKEAAERKMLRAKAITQFDIFAEQLAKEICYINFGGRPKETAMNVKLTIKETTEETKIMTIPERCMYNVSIDCTFTQEFRDLVKRELDKIGFVKIVGPRCQLGIFRKVTIRDATPEEVIAWHCISIWGICFKTKCFGVTACIRDEKCPKNDGTKNPCPVRDEWDRAEEILEGKEVIVEVVK